jgi:hypothetical protein
MTAANLMINVARGFGPSLIILGQTVFGVDRQYSFNFTVRYVELCFSMIDIQVHVLVSHLDAANSNLTVFGFLQLIVFWTITTFCY